MLVVANWHVAFTVLYKLMVSADLKPFLLSRSHPNSKVVGAMRMNVMSACPVVFSAWKGFEMSSHLCPSKQLALAVVPVLDASIAMAALLDLCFATARWRHAALVDFRPGSQSHCSSLLFGLLARVPKWR